METAACDGCRQRDCRRHRWGGTPALYLRAAELSEHTPRLTGPVAAASRRHRSIFCLSRRTRNAESDAVVLLCRLARHGPARAASVSRSDAGGRTHRHRAYLRSPRKAAIVRVDFRNWPEAECSNSRCSRGSARPVDGSTVWRQVHASCSAEAFRMQTLALSDEQNSAKKRGRKFVP